MILYSRFVMIMTVTRMIFLIIKRPLFLCRLNSEESIQMVTALALQLIQCVIRLPTTSSSLEPPTEEEVPSSSSKKAQKSRRGQVRPANLSYWLIKQCV